MSARTRSRKGKSTTRKKRGPARRASMSPRLNPAERLASVACPCPACSGEVFDLGPMVDAVTMYLNEFDDVLEAELMAARLVAAATSLGGAIEVALEEGLVPEFEARATEGALAMLLAVGAVAPAQGGKAAWSAADRLIGSGVPVPRWAAQLDEPLRVTECLRAYDTDATGALLVCAFHRGDRSHAFAMSVDELDCGAAVDLTLFDPDELPEVLDSFQALGRTAGKEMAKESLDPAEFRWHVEKALAARAVHSDGLEAVQPDADGIPSCAALAVLLLARIAALPVPTRPAPPHGDGGGGGLDALQRLVRLLGDAQLIAPAASGRVQQMPPKRRKAAGPAPCLSAQGPVTRLEAPYLAAARGSIRHSLWIGCMRSSRSHSAGAVATCTSSRHRTGASATRTRSSVTRPTRR